MKSQPDMVLGFWFFAASIKSCLIFLDQDLFFLTLHSEHKLAHCYFLMLKSCWFLFVVQFSAAIQRAQPDESYTYRVKLHTAIKPGTRMMKTSWAQRQLFSFCSRQLLLAITCNTWDMQTDEEGNIQPGCIYSLWTLINLPVKISAIGI